MSRPQPTFVVHFTSVDHLGSIAAEGLLADTGAQGRGVLEVEIGNTDIKARRARREVPVAPNGVVADYVPFYFAPRSPMMYSIHRGNVPTYQDGCDRLVYLVTTVERLHELGLPIVLTDRNAVLGYTDFVSFSDGLVLDDDFIDWPLMEEQYWKNTPDQPQRVERRMAECLVHQRVPWEAISEVVTNSLSVALEAEGLLASLKEQATVSVRGGWYF